MIWIFLAVVLVLAVSHPGFRKFLLGSGAVILAGLAITVGVLIVQDHEKKQVAAMATAAYQQCMAAHPEESSKDSSGHFDPDAYLFSKCSFGNVR